MSLKRCAAVFGAHRILPGRPPVERRRNALVANNALYDETGLLIHGSSYMRGEAEGAEFRMNLFAPPQTSFNRASGRVLPPGRYLWLGYFHAHFGHFLLSSLQRLWALDDVEIQGLQILTPILEARILMQAPFILNCLAALGVAPEQIVPVETGTVVPDIIVPGPMIVETAYAYAGWSGFMQQLSDRLSSPQDGRRAEEPVFLSRQNLVGGTRGLANENELVPELQRSGMRVVSPETMSLKEQIALWRDHDTFIGFSGSAFHTAAFVRGKRIITLHRNQFAQGNQTLIDEACGHRALYLNAAEHLSHVGQDREGFNELDALRDPRALAAAMLDAVETLSDGYAGMRPLAADQTVATRITALEPFGRNVARGKRCRASSVDPVHSVSHGDAEQEGAGLVSGRASRSFQLHTATQQDPWWQVDLGTPHHVYEVRVFNRHDGDLHRAAGIVILTSDDGQSWEERDRRNGAPFGGGPMPNWHSWHPESPVQTRWVRVLARIHDPLHLDQVEVFGDPVAEAGPLRF